MAFWRRSDRWARSRRDWSSRTPGCWFVLSPTSNSWICCSPVWRLTVRATLLKSLLFNWGWNWGKLNSLMVALVPTLPNSVKTLAALVVVAVARVAFGAAGELREALPDAADASGEEGEWVESEAHLWGPTRWCPTSRRGRPHPFCATGA